ncbi:MAG: hypothetical protein AAGG08_16900 [Actinomycetota bacterium]
MPDPATDSITIHSSWRGIISSFIGASFVLIVASIVVAVNGVSTGTSIVLAVGVLFVVGVLADYPIASTFDRHGVTRRAVMRRHRLAWDRVDQLTRTRPGIVAQRRKVVQGGLTAVVGRRRYLLVNHVESLGEHELLDDVLADHDLAFGLLLRPPDDVPPTWLYRRAHWKPDSAR